MLDTLKRDYPLTESQLLFWRGHQLQPDVPLYNMAWRFDLYGPIDPDRFGRSLSEVIAASDALRAVFRIVDGLPRQYVSEAPFDWAGEIDLSGDINPEDALRRLVATITSEPFDLSLGSFRTQLVKMSESHWVWLCCQHHIICDAQSGAVLFKAMSDRYLGLVNDVPSFFERAEAIALADEALGTEKSDGETPGGPPYGGSLRRSPASQRSDIDISDHLLARFDEFALSPNNRLITPDLSKLAAYLTCYFAFLSRVTGDEAITIGLPAHNRLSATDRLTLGLFVEVLPLCVKVEAEDTFADLHTNVKTALGDFLRTARPNAVKAQSQKAIGSILNFIQARFADFAGLPAKVEWHHSGTHDANHALRLHVTDFDGTGTPRMSMDVNEEILALTSAQDIGEHFRLMLDHMVERPGLKIAAAGLISYETEQDLKKHFKGPAETADRNASIVDLVATQVQRSPSAVAIREGEEEISYQEFWDKSAGFASRLKREEFRTGSVVALHLPRGIDFVVSVLGVMRAGHLFVPIAANTPEMRFKGILRESGAKALVTHTESIRDEEIVKIKPWESGEPTPDTLPKPGDTAYVLFTSGSTGKPKGVEVTHDGLSRYIQWAAREFGSNRPKDYAFFSSVSFDLTITSIFAPIVTGGRIVVYPENSEPDFAVLDVFVDDQVDVVKLTPSHLSLVCANSQPVETIKTLVLGGENLSTGLCRLARRALSSDITIINEYGPTESVVGCMIHKYDPQKDCDASVPIGRPASGVTISVRDAGLNPCPVGVAGEIFVSRRLSKGYFNALDLTAERFVTDPKNLTERLYRTGDIGRLRKDGVFEYLGRADEQFKVGGVRIEAAEIENAIRSVPGVRDVYVALPQKGPAERAPNRFCVDCGLPDNLPDAHLDDSGRCSICSEFDTYKDRAQAYFRSEPEFEQKVRAAAEKSTGEYDAVMLLSGGKDSTYAAYRLGALTDRVLAVTLDNDYIADGAKANIRRVSEHLGWDHRFLRTDKMNEIFVDSLKSHSNVCQGCFKTIYTLALRTARDEGVPIIVTGLSRGQFFETRLTPELFQHASPSCGQLEQIVERARKTYHSEHDRVAKILKTDDIMEGTVLEDIEFVDIFRYIDVSVSEIYAFLGQHASWIRPKDTGRSTNCLINDVGIYVHKTREGFHNYALPYSWDVRMGHKTRFEALDELNDQIDTDRVHEILDEIGFDEPLELDQQKIVAYVAAEVGSEDRIRSAMQERLPRELRPTELVILDRLPITNNGKIDSARLPQPDRSRKIHAVFVPPSTETERQLSDILMSVLGRGAVGLDDDFFDLDVDSLGAIQIAIAANEVGLSLHATALFEYRTLRALAQFADTLEVHQVGMSGNSPLLELDEDDFAQIAKALN